MDIWVVVLVATHIVDCIVFSYFVWSDLIVVLLVIWSENLVFCNSFAALALVCFQAFPCLWNVDVPTSIVVEIGATCELLQVLCLLSGIRTRGLVLCGRQVVVHIHWYGTSLVMKRSCIFCRFARRFLGSSGEWIWNDNVLWSILFDEPSLILCSG